MTEKHPIVHRIALAVTAAVFEAVDEAGTDYDSLFWALTRRARPIVKSLETIVGHPVGFGFELTDGCSVDVSVGENEIFASIGKRIA